MTNSMLQFEIVAAIIALAALLIFYVAYKLLASKNWILGWIRGTSGMLLVLLTAAIVMFIIDVRTYRPMFDDRTIATVNISRLSEGEFQLRMVDADGIESRYPVSGERWSLVINQYKWSTRMIGIGLGHGYRMNKLLELDINDKKISELPLSHSEYIDSWKWVSENIPHDFFISADIVKPKSLPLVDGGIYEIIPSANNIFIKPVNDIAIKANASTQAPVISDGEKSPIVNPAVVVPEAPPVLQQ